MAAWNKANDAQIINASQVAYIEANSRLADCVEHPNAQKDHRTPGAGQKPASPAIASDFGCPAFIEPNGSICFQGSISNVPEISAGIQKPEDLNELTNGIGRGALSLGNQALNFLSKREAVNNALIGIGPMLDTAVDYYSQATPQKIATDSQEAAMAISEAVDSSTISHPMKQREIGSQVPAAAIVFIGANEKIFSEAAAEKLGLEKMSAEDLYELGVTRVNSRFNAPPTKAEAEKLFAQAHQLSQQDSLAPSAKLKEEAVQRIEEAKERIKESKQSASAMRGMPNPCHGYKTKYPDCTVTDSPGGTRYFNYEPNKAFSNTDREIQDDPWGVRTVVDYTPYSGKQAEIMRDYPDGTRVAYSSIAEKLNTESLVRRFNPDGSTHLMTMQEYRNDPKLGHWWSSYDMKQRFLGK